jgi:hypothetical protein
VQRTPVSLAGLARDLDERRVEYAILGKRTSGGIQDACAACEQHPVARAQCYVPPIAGDRDPSLASAGVACGSLRPR